ncbi:hypothetical protein DPMN_103009 [Dreissena polymorpha]|uniref:Uncharacterized protein n=1 Tax=Dreissena polymorpha TaxID=45954 RepID=A0A9D4HA87_DREPO|nr:hypothetical protein DPMN_103009 [Dreissena polymorpha]
MRTGVTTRASFSWFIVCYGFGSGKAPIGVLLGREGTPAKTTKVRMGPRGNVAEGVFVEDEVSLCLIWP